MSDLPTFLRGLSQAFRQPGPSFLLHEAGDLIEAQAAENRRLREREAEAARLIERAIAEYHLDRAMENDFRAWLAASTSARRISANSPRTPL